MLHEELQRFRLRNIQKNLSQKGDDYATTNEFVQSHFSDGVLIVHDKKNGH
jgi:hypothetical protein